MYLSRLILNVTDWKVRRDLAYPYELHRTVFSGFPESIGQLGERVLYRLDHRQMDGSGSQAHPVLLVQSTTPPSWDHLAGARGRPPFATAMVHSPVVDPLRRGRNLRLAVSIGDGTSAVADSPWRGTDYAGYLLPLAACPCEVESNPSIRELDPRFKPGQVLAFRLRANPTVKKDREGKEQGRRLGILREEDQIKWLQQKGERGGFRLLSVQTSPGGIEVIARARGAGARAVKMLAVQFDGLLQVNDPEAFRQTMEEGIGSGKGFGFGMLSLARPR